MLQRIPQWLRHTLVGQQFRPGARRHATRRLRLLLGASLLCLALPLALLLSRVYRQLEREVFYQHRAAAEEVLRHINQRLADILQAEEHRPFDEYSFLKVTANPLFKGSAIVASPLSELPPQSTMPGVIGYFQINPDGSFHSPVLPELDEAELAANVDRFGFGSSELAKRLALRGRLEELLRASSPVTERRPRPKHVAPSSATPSSPAPTAASHDAVEKAFSLPDQETARRGEAAKTATTGSGESASSRMPRRDIPSVPSEAAQSPSPQQPIPQKPLAGAKASSYRERRKEQVTLPEQSTVSQVQKALDSLNALPPDVGRTIDRRASLPAPSVVVAPQEQKARTVKILTFESEVDPFQFTVLSTGPLVFFRKAWRNNLRYIQGFVVDRAESLQQLIEPPVSGTTLGQWASLTVHYQGQQLFSRPPVQTSSRRTQTTGPSTPALRPLYSATLDAPLDAVELVYSARHVPRSAGATVVDALTLSLIIVLLASHYGLYRLGLHQIELAAQHSDFVAAVSHELRTPLTAIRMYGEMLRAGWVHDESRRQSYYDFIFFESERLSRLIANVLQFARLTNHDAPLALKEYTLGSLLDVVRSKISTQVEASGFELRFLAEGSAADLVVASVLADEDAFVQIFINLVDNGLKFSVNATDKRIDVGLRHHASQPRHAVLCVRDYGPGVARDQMQRIFQLFYRAEDELTRQTRGTGIGLALVKALATKMNATVALHNHNPGAEFQLIIPTLDG